MSELTIKEHAYNGQKTMRHIERVRNLLNMMVIELLRRGELHDQSKLVSPEVQLLAKAPAQETLKYGTPEYEESVKNLDSALEHHYANNRHHPQHWKRGIRDMNLIDLLEMFVDWKASSECYNAGNLRLSIETNGKRFNMPPELVEIFENTVELVE